MENQSQTTPATAPSAPAATPMPAPAPTTNAVAQGQGQKIVAPEKQPGQPRVAGSPKVSNDVFVRKIVEKIRNSENILVALSRDPSVDEMAAAIGLTLFLDSLQKHTTAIYSGQTPDALQFLQPEGTFETNTDSLQDFIIALNKDKADHLRYKLDGDFVKVYITPYKSNITENDLEFSHGDFNVNLVLALGVPSAADLDSALEEHGRIMHDATTVDITIDAPGKFAEIEWSDPGASSVSEMVTKLIFAMQGEDVVLDKETATALLTGIVAATGRFSNDRTNSDTMQLASKLMAMGADQQLISAHVMNNDTGLNDLGMTVPRNTDLAVGHGVATEMSNGPEIAMEGAVVTPVVAEGQTDGAVERTMKQPEGASRAELAAAASAAVSEAVATAAANAAAAAGKASPEVASSDPMTVERAPEVQQGVAPEMATVPEAQAAGVDGAPGVTTGRKDYAQMLEQALVESASGMDGNAMPTGPIVTPNVVSEPAMSSNPAAQAAPAEVAQNVEPMAKPAGVTLPPPPEPMPVPTTDMMPPTLPNDGNVVTNGAENVISDDAMLGDATNNASTAATQGDAFQIPGMN